MMLSNSWLVVESTTVSICGKGKESLGHALLRSMKYMHTVHFLFFLPMTTTLANQSRYYTSLTDPMLSNFSTSSFITLLRSSANFCLFCLTGLNFEFTFSWCEITLRSMPIISWWLQSKQWHLVDRNWMSLSLIGSSNLDPISTFLLESNGWMGTSSSVYSTSSVGEALCNFYAAAVWGFSPFA